MRTCVPTLTEATASFGMISESRVKSSMRSMVTTRVGDDIGGSSASGGNLFIVSGLRSMVLVGSMLTRRAGVVVETRAGPWVADARVRRSVWVRGCPCPALTRRGRPRGGHTRRGTFRREAPRGRERQPRNALPP